ncbi:Syntaxin 6 [Macleaya cordata]|uniref:Syntaxin 6 n=1 Tax=Macleaya cordata TaxID=56857 RepID=A0A200QHU0_MACCD|nr:Syntaxin 6 [Macleaya cordata]
MTTSIREWESDPLFSAAEVVQDSADRMDSIYRIMLHEQSLVHEDAADPKLHSSIDYHRRDLVTALGTTKWQLEDFERAVNLSAISDGSRMREDAISRHKQFIRAIQEHISHVEKSLDDPSAGEVANNKQWVNLDEQDRDGLALFLSGGNSIDHRVLYDSENSSIMRRFLDSTTASGFDDNSDEIIELKSEENEDNKMNGVMHIDRGFDSVKENKLRKVGSNYSTRFGHEASVSIQEGLGDEVGGGVNWDLEGCDSNAKSFFSKSKLRGSRWLDILEFFSKFWSIYGSKMTRSFTKRRKDGEVRDGFDQRPSSSYASYMDICQAEQGQHAWMGLASGYGGCRALYSNVLRNTMKSCSWFGICKGRFTRYPPTSVFLNVGLFSSILSGYRSSETNIGYLSPESENQPAARAYLSIFQGQEGASFALPGSVWKCAYIHAVSFLYLDITLPGKLMHLRKTSLVRVAVRHAPVADGEIEVAGGGIPFSGRW